MKTKTMAALSFLLLQLFAPRTGACLENSAGERVAGAAAGQLFDVYPALTRPAGQEPRPPLAPAPEAGAPAAKALRKKPAVLRYSPECVLKAVALLMGQKYRPDIPLPKIFFESSVPLKQFQDAVEPQWGQRPARLSNVYVWSRNEIYLMDDAAWYAAHERAMDDSLAHEFVHYIQDRYRGWDLSLDDPGYEPQAVEFQTLFRENYINKPGTCPG